MWNAGVYWLRWERFTRYGIKLRGKRISSAQLLQVWALTLVALYGLVWMGGTVEKIPAASGLELANELEVEPDFWRDRHLVFCISPGRSGSEYLRNVLNVADGIISTHEPDPQLNGRFLREVILEGKREETYAERAIVKLSAIRNMLEGTTPDVGYAETSHMFAKTYADVVLQKLGDVAKISIIFLRRPAKETIWSQVRLGWFTKGHSGKDVWYYDPNDVHPSERQISHYTNSTDRIDTLIGYNADVLQRGIKLEREVKKRHRDGKWRRVRIFEVLLKDISGDSAEEGVTRVLGKMGLKIDRHKLLLLSDQDKNSRDVKKDRVRVDATMEEIVSRLEDLMDKLPLMRDVLY